MFGSNEYKDLIRKLQNNGLEFSIDWNKDFSQNYLLLRHDVDFSIQHAYEIAKIDESLKVFSTIPKKAFGP